jgi:predicted phage tail protein
VTGAALIAVSIYFPELGVKAIAMMQGMGAAMVIGGVATVFMDAPYNPGITGDPAGSKPNQFFDGAINTVAQGHPVPIGYGRMRIGSAVISTGSSPESYPTGANGGAFGASDGAGTMVGNGDTSPWIWSIDPAV